MHSWAARRMSCRQPWSGDFPQGQLLLLSPLGPDGTQHVMWLHTLIEPLLCASYGAYWKTVPTLHGKSSKKAQLVSPGPFQRC